MTKKELWLVKDKVHMVKWSKNTDVLASRKGEEGKGKPHVGYRKN